MNGKGVFRVFAVAAILAGALLGLDGHSGVTNPSRLAEASPSPATVDGEMDITIERELPIGKYSSLYLAMMVPFTIDLGGKEWTVYGKGNVRAQTTMEWVKDFGTGPVGFRCNDSHPGKIEIYGLLLPDYEGQQGVCMLELRAHVDMEAYDQHCTLLAGMGETVSDNKRVEPESLGFGPAFLTPIEGASEASTNPLVCVEDTVCVKETWSVNKIGSLPDSAGCLGYSVGHGDGQGEAPEQPSDQ